MLDSTQVGRAFAAVAGADADPFAADAKAARTWITYQSALKNFEAWCAETGAVALPAETATIRRWLQHLSITGLSGTTCHTYLTAVCTRSRMAGHPINRRPLSETLKAITKRSTRPRRARPLLTDELRAIVDRLDPKRPKDTRDASLLMLGFAASLRQCEVAGLDWLKTGPKRDGGTGFLTYMKGGFEVVLVTSKTAQATEVLIPIPDVDMPSLRPWLERWVAAAKIEPGQPLFRSVDRNGRISTRRVEPRVVCDVVRARVRQQVRATGTSLTEAWELGQKYSGHSLRSGMCTASALAGVFEFKIRDRARHKSSETTAKYIRAARQVTDSALKGIGI